MKKKIFNGINKESKRIDNKIGDLTAEQKTKSVVKEWHRKQFPFLTPKPLYKK